MANIDVKWAGLEVRISLELYGDRLAALTLSGDAVGLHGLDLLGLNKKMAMFGTVTINLKS